MDKFGNQEGDRSKSLSEPTGSQDVTILRHIDMQSEVYSHIIGTHYPITVDMECKPIIEYWQLS